MKNEIHNEELHFLAETAMAFAEMPLNGDIYKYIGEKVRELIGDSIVTVNSFDEKANSICPRAVLGIGKQLSAVIKIMGQDPVGKPFIIDHEAKQGLTLAKLTEVPGGMISLSPGTPKVIWGALEKFLGVGKAYVRGFVREGKLFGSITLLMPKDVELIKIDTIEIFANQASVALQRKQAFDELKEYGDHLEDFVKKRTEDIQESNLRLQREMIERKQIEENFRAIAENSIDGIVITVEEGKHIYANRRASEITLYSVEELLKTTIKDLAHPDEYSKLQERYKSRIQGKPAQNHYETLIVRKDGKIIPVEIGGTQTIWQGKLADMVLFRDISQRKQAEASIKRAEELMQKTFNSLQDAVFILDAKTTEVLRCNPAASVIFGYSADEIIGKTTAHLHVSEKTLGEFRIHLQQAITEKGFMVGFEFKMKRINGDIFPTEHSVTPVMDEPNNQIGWVSVVRDITKRVNAREQREKLIAELMNALSEVKKLSGLLPICMYCKKIRDDKGYWSEVEKYVSSHSEAEFSHGLCPDCTKKYHPGVYEKMKNQGKLDHPKDSFKNE